MVKTPSQQAGINIKRTSVPIVSVASVIAGFGRCSQRGLQGQDSGELDSVRPMMERGGAWKQTHGQVRKAHGIGADFVRWTPTHQMRGVPLTGRAADCVDLAYQLVLKRAAKKYAEDAKVDVEKVNVSDLPLSAQRCEDYIIDVSQSGSRGAYATK
eukprot:6469546-Amphidinium_carterae.1